MKTRTIRILIVLTVLCLITSCGFEITVLNNAPAAPELQAPVADASAVGKLPTLSWSAAADPDGDVVTYDLYLDSNAAPAVKVATVGGTSFTVESALADSTAYSWKVVAVDAYGLSASSAVRGFTTKASDTTAPSDVTNLKAFPGDLYVTLAWTDPADADFTHVLITSTGLESAVIAVAGKGQCRVAVPRNRSSYEFLVQAVDDSGNKSAGVASGRVKPYKRQSIYTRFSAAGTPSSAQVFEWDELERMSRYYYYSTSNALPTTYVYEYGANGLTYKITFYNNSAALQTYEIYEYDSGNHLLGSKRYNTADALTYYITYTYDSAWRTAGYVSYDAVGAVQSSYAYDYDAAGNRIQSRYYNSSGALSSSTTYEYDSEGNTTKYNSYNSSGTLTSINEYVYDSDMTLLKTNQYDVSGTLTYYSMYFYD